jgi:hypothetical protein
MLSHAVLLIETPRHHVTVEYTPVVHCVQSTEGVTASVQEEMQDKTNQTREDEDSVLLHVFGPSLDVTDPGITQVHSLPD